MILLLNVFSLGDYTPDAAGFAEAKNDNATETLVADPSCVNLVIMNAFAVARKLGYEVCVSLKLDNERRFLLAKDFTSVVMQKAPKIKGRLREIHQLLSKIDDLSEIECLDTDCLTRQAEAMLEAWIVHAQNMPVLDEGISPSDARYAVMISDRWHYAQYGGISEIDDQTLVYRSIYPDNHTESGTALLGNWAEVVDGEPVINLTLDDIRSIPRHKLPR